jgi:hypothetical protein
MRRFSRSQGGGLPLTLILAVLGPACFGSIPVFSGEFLGIVEFKNGIVWPKPKMVDPGVLGGHPSDAIVLFDGKSMSAWEGGGNWIVQDGCATAHKQSIRSKQSFGDCQLHVEWATPAVVTGHSQGRGNSGVFMMGKFEIQVLDSYNNDTYPDGQAAGVYKQRPPLVNVCRKPGEWQTYDIVFRVPHFDPQGKLLQPAFVTVLQNGVLVLDHFQIQGETSYVAAPVYHPLPAKGPIELQYHNNPVRFRNIWLREL